MEQLTPATAALVYVSEEDALFLRDFVLLQTNEPQEAGLWLDFFFKTLKQNFSSLYITKTSCLQTYCQTYNLIELEHDSEIALMNRIWQQQSSIESVALFEGIYPMLDSGATRELYAIHCQYRAEFTLGENLPQGLAPYFFSRDFLQTFHDIHNSNEDDLSSFHFIASYAQKNIQKFHSEIYFFEPDIRSYRFNFLLKNRRNYYLIRDFWSRTQNTSENLRLQDIAKVLQDSPQILASIPAYLEVELVSDCEYACTFCPRSFTEFAKLTIDTTLLLARLKEFAQNSFGDTAVAFGGMGEPLQHPQFKEILLQTINLNNFSFVLIETNGFYLSRLQESALTKENLKKLQVIVNINAADEAYSVLHGCTQDNLPKILQHIKSLAELYKEQGIVAAEHIWIQALKLEENEQQIDAIFELSDRLGVSFLLQKYNRFEVMPEKRLSDMTPLKRSFCWHLARDLYIRADGSVAFCKQDIEGKCLTDSLNEKSLQEIFANRKKYFVKNFKENYDFCKCKNCDEYYTFNN